MRAIVLVDQNWGIGKDGEQILYLKDDLARFVRLTRGHVVIYGRKTMETFPGARPLKNRKNIILSRSIEAGQWPDRDAIVLRSIPELHAELKKLRAEAYLEEEFFLLGGASLYHELLPELDQLDVTYVKVSKAADLYFPDLDKNPNFVLSECSREFSGQSECGTEVKYEYRSYRRRRESQ
ncbi:MAG: dihydrofolate reductase [Eubacteriales bacterium]|nr:dihydrofolate reductase [Eubacteriales bacterium]